MPHSDAQGKDTVRAWYEQEIIPTTVVDIGAGAGTYAKLLRGNFQHSGTHWTAVEAWEPYVEEFKLFDWYESVVVTDVRHLNWPTFRADLVIAGDVLEHMPRDDAKVLLKRIRQGAANLIVSIPVLHLPQGAVNGNPYERHVDHWTAAGMRQELETYGTVREQWIGDVLAYFWWSREGLDQP